MSEYILSTGDDDYQRLKLLSRMYNPGALAFMQKAGLRPGMKVLEIGCGTGHMAVELARVVGKDGIVFAVDKSLDQLKVAKKTAEEAGVNNIEFAQFDLESDLPRYQNQFDFIYGRWVIEFTQNASERVFAELFQTLKSGGILTYESVDMNDTGVFTYPDLTMTHTYSKIGYKLFSSNNMPLDFIKRTYFLLKELGAKNITMGPNQAILRTSEEKSVMRLGFVTAEKVLRGKVFSDAEFDQLIADYTALELSDNIVGFYRNYLVSGKRS